MMDNRVDTLDDGAPSVDPVRSSNEDTEARISCEDVPSEEVEVLVTSSFGAGTPRHVSTRVASLFPPVVDVPIGSCVARWSLTDGKRQMLFQAHKDAVTCLRKSPCMDLVATASHGGEIRLWNLRWLPRSKTVLVKDGHIVDLAWRPDGKRLAVCVQSKNQQRNNRGHLVSRPVAISEWEVVPCNETKPTHHGSERTTNNVVDDDEAKNHDNDNYEDDDYNNNENDHCSDHGNDDNNGEGDGGDGESKAAIASTTISPSPATDSHIPEYDLVHTGTFRHKYVWCEYTSCGKLFAVKKQKAAGLFELQLLETDGTLMLSSRIHARQITSISRCDTGPLLAIISSERHIWVVDEDTLELRCEFDAIGSGIIRSVLWWKRSGRTSLVCPSDNGSIGVWNVSQPLYTPVTTPSHLFTCPRGDIHSLLWLRTGRSLAIFTSTGIYRVDITRHLEASGIGLPDMTNALFSIDNGNGGAGSGSGGGDGVNAGNESSDDSAQRALGDGVLCAITYGEVTCCGLGVSPDGKQVAVGDFGANVMVWSVGGTLHEPQFKCTMPGRSPIRSVAWVGTQTLLIGDLDGNVWLWSLTTPTRPERVASLNGGITCISLRPHALPWDPALSQDRPSPAEIRSEASSAKSSSGSCHVAFGTTGGFLAVYELECGGATMPGSSVRAKPLLVVLAHPPIDDGHQEGQFGSIDQFAEVWSLCWSPDGTSIATCSEDQNTLVWKNVLTSGNRCTGVSAPSLTLSGHTHAVTCVDWADTRLGEVIATCADDCSVCIWDVGADGKKSQLLDTFVTENVGGWHTITYVSLESGGSRVVCGTENGWILIWSLTTSKCLFAGKMHLGSVEGLHWHHRTQQISSCGSDCVVNVYSLLSELTDTGDDGIYVGEKDGKPPPLSKKERNPKDTSGKFLFFF
eukprot:TRINITY_DN8633_c0_g1_i2.p1 TRINITY_DN8633_c0_g1~~TRINITY_DN8633_c0_g1_i2.p1  ORF type:complete len:911 (-),score=128.56 TRINITY_DN8633_c0_g1_i2:23-2755(-)